MATTSDNSSPGILGVFLGALLSVSLGALLAVIHAATLPVEVLKTAPKEAPAPGARVIVLGAPGASAGKTWQVKQDALVSGSKVPVTFTEAELNAWSAATFEAAKPDPNSPEAKTVMILAGVPNFRIDGDRLQVGTVNTVHFFGSESPLVLQARGGFAQTGGSWHYVPDQAYLGGLPLHKVPALAALVAGRFGAAQAPEAVEKVLRGAREIAVRDGALTITMQ